MKYLSFATGLLILGIAVATAARVDFAVVQFGSGS